MRTNRLVIAACVILLSSLCASALQAQITLRPRFDLRFGDMPRGTVTSIPPNNFGSAARFEIRGARGTVLDLDFTLPIEMTSVGGDAVPLSFDVSDGLILGAEGSFWSSFDPTATTRVTIGWFGRLWIFLGGDASPRTNQTSGSYSSTITLTVTGTGIDESADVDAIGDITGLTPIAATGINDLDFGPVLSDGGTYAPAILAADAGRWEISGEPGANVTVDFTLPAALSNVPGDLIPLTFGANDGLIWDPFPASYSTFDPRVTHNDVIDATGMLVVGITGLITPPIGVPPGPYSATITLTVAYF